MNITNKKIFFLFTMTTLTIAPCNGAMNEPKNATASSEIGKKNALEESIRKFNFEKGYNEICKSFHNICENSEEDWNLFNFKLPDKNYEKFLNILKEKYKDKDKDKDKFSFFVVKEGENFKDFTINVKNKTLVSEYVQSSKSSAKLMVVSDSIEALGIKENTDNLVVEILGKKPSLKRLILPRQNSITIRTYGRIDLNALHLIENSNIENSNIDEDFSITVTRFFEKISPESKVFSFKKQPAEEDAVQKVKNFLKSTFVSTNKIKSSYSARSNTASIMGSPKKIHYINPIMRGKVTASFNKGAPNKPFSNFLEPITRKSVVPNSQRNTGSQTPSRKNTAIFQSATKIGQRAFGTSVQQSKQGSVNHNLQRSLASGNQSIMSSATSFKSNTSHHDQRQTMPIVRGFCEPNRDSVTSNTQRGGLTNKFNSLSQVAGNTTIVVSQKQETAKERAKQSPTMHSQIELANKQKSSSKNSASKSANPSENKSPVTRSQTKTESKTEDANISSFSS